MKDHHFGDGLFIDVIWRKMIPLAYIELNLRNCASGWMFIAITVVAFGLNDLPPKWCSVQPNRKNGDDIMYCKKCGLKMGECVKQIGFDQRTGKPLLHRFVACQRCNIEYDISVQNNDLPQKKVGSSLVNLIAYIIMLFIDAQIVLFRSPSFGIIGFLIVIAYGIYFKAKDKIPNTDTKLVRNGCIGSFITLMAAYVFLFF